MIKSPILDLRSGPESLKNTIRSKWFLLLILFPIVSYGIYLGFESQLVTFVSSLFPVEGDKSHGFYRDFLALIFNEILWLSGFLLLAWIFVVYLPLNQAFNAIEAAVIKHKVVYSTAVILLTFIASLFTAFNVLEGFPNSSDEYTYLFQAQTMAKGALWEFSHDLHQFFFINHIAQQDGITVGRFPPGWPAILSVAYVLKFSPMLVNPVLGLVGLVVFYSFAKQVYGDKVALWSLPLVAFTSFFIFNAGSYFSHTSCLVAVLLFVYGIYLYQQRKNFWYLVMSGFFLGVVVTIRYYTAVIISLPFFFYLIYHYRWSAVRVFFFMGVGGLPCIALMLWYNYSITGSPLLPVTMWAYQDEALGFVRGHTVIKGLEHVVRWLSMFIYWCSPGILILYFILLCKKIVRKEERVVHPEDYSFALLTVAYFFYYQVGGNQYGPRFLFESFPFVILFIVNIMVTRRQKWVIAMVFASVIFAVVKMPFIAVREHRVVEERTDLFDKVKDARISNAVIFISTHVGVIRPMPIGDLARNDVHYLNDVIYAHDLKSKNVSLMRYYPDRTYYRYVRDKEVVEGKLVRIYPSDYQ